MASTTTTTTTKNNNDPYTGTEYQHDFGHFGFGVSRIKNNKSQQYRNYVDKKHTWNQNITNRQEWVFSDEGLVKYRLKTTNTTTNQVNIDKKHLRSLPETNNTPHTIYIRKGKRDGNTYNTYKICVVNNYNGSKTGAKLFNLLGIPNNSLTVIDTDQVIKTYLKQNSDGHSSRRQEDKDITLYIVKHPIVSADSAKKGNINNKHLFSTYPGKGINCKALIFTRETIINAANNVLKMNYEITNKYVTSAITRQVWKPHFDDGNFEHTPLHHTGLQFDNANETNNKNNVAKIATKLLKTTDGVEHLKDPVLRQGMLRRNISSDDAILALMRKRSGDLFQGELTRMMKENGNIFNDGSLEVEESWWMKDTNGWTFKKDERIWNNFKDNNVFTTTIDYPYLVWCLENGVNVLFTVAGKIMYFKLEN
tara:strand:- start:6731 stop:7996 length:1266 start_codon:yes stop_codon:yes gene_type:complete